MRLVFLHFMQAYDTVNWDKINLRVQNKLIQINTESKVLIETKPKKKTKKNYYKVKTCLFNLALEKIIPETGIKRN